MNALEPLLAHFLRVRRVCPNAQAADNGVALPAVGAQVFPWKIAVAVLPFRVRMQDAVGCLAHQPQIADVQDGHAVFVAAVGIDKGVKLFHIAHRLRSLLGDPQLHARLQGIAQGGERAVGQERALGDGQYPQTAVGNGNQYGNQLDDALRRGFGFGVGVHARLSAGGKGFIVNQSGLSERSGSVLRYRKPVFRRPCILYSS